MSASLRLRTIDAHAAGAALRLIVDGFPAVRARTMEERGAWVEDHATAIRAALLREPRGHADMLGAVLTEPVSDAAVAGVLFFAADGPCRFAGHALIAAVTIALERRLLVTSGGGSLVFDTSDGPIAVRATIERDTSEGAEQVTQVAYRTGPVVVSRPALPLTVDGRLLPCDIVWASGFYALVDREALGVPPESGGLERLRASARQLVTALEARIGECPLPPGSSARVAGVIFSGPPGTPAADLRSITVYADGTVDRSPSGEATAAVLGVLDAMGLADAGRTIVHEGPSTLCLGARVAARLELPGVTALVAEVTGRAWITGEHAFVIDSGDPLARGFSW